MIIEISGESYCFTKYFAPPPQIPRIGPAAFSPFTPAKRHLPARRRRRPRNVPHELRRTFCVKPRSCFYSPLGPYITSCGGGDPATCRGAGPRRAGGVTRRGSRPRTPASSESAARRRGRIRVRQKPTMRWSCAGLAKGPPEASRYRDVPPPPPPPFPSARAAKRCEGGLRGAAKSRRSGLGGGRRTADGWPAPEALRNRAV